jgi:acyl carrier protein
LKPGFSCHPNGWWENEEKIDGVKMADVPSNHEVTDQVISMFVKSTGWYKKELPLDAHLTHDLKTDGDDISFLFEEVEQHFDMRLTQNEWGKVASLQGIVDLVLRYQGVKLRPPDPKVGFWKKLWACIK